MSIAQVFFSSLSGIVRHHRNRLVNRTALLYIGATMAAGSLLGAALSKIVSGEALLVVFGVLALGAAGMMLLKPPTEGSAGSDEVISVNKPIALIVGWWELEAVSS